MQYVINDKAIIFFHAGSPVKVEKTSPEYHRLIKAFDLPAEKQDKAIVEILSEKKGKFKKDGFSISPSKVKYKGQLLPEPLADKVRKIASEGLPVKLFAKFWENLTKNPSANSVRQLYDFLAYKELPITEDGYFLAYKGVNQNGWSISGNTKTTVLQGDTDSSGRIQNNVGDVIEVERWDVDDNRENQCSFGLHVGSLNYAKSFGYKTLVVKINPKDVVSVPEDCSCQKCRVSLYEVIDSYESEITASVTDESGVAIQSESSQESTEVLDRIQNYLNKKADKGLTKIEVQKIQNSFSPDYVGRIRILDALNSLGYVWKLNKHGKHIVKFG